ncbi:MAG: hypothetical protein IJ706_09565 [Clostridia bacterium]|nr:hypothetical protein [Clostridia bacterium]
MKRDKTFNLNGTWDLYYIRHSEFDPVAFENAPDKNLCRFSHISANVPGNFELDFEKAGILPELFYSTNILELKKIEDLHLFYVKKFDCVPSVCDLVFEGIDTFADVYLNGKKIYYADNMFVEHVIESIKTETENTLTVHIRPAVIEAQKTPTPEYCFFGKYNYESAYVRKAPHMYGWDIMPRAISGGLWKDVYLKEHKDERINGFKYNCSFVGKEIKLKITVDVSAADGAECAVLGKCGESVFKSVSPVIHGTSSFEIFIEKPLLWYPKNYGRQNLYDLTLILYRNGKEIDVYCDKIGLRTVELVRTSCVEDDESGDFCFVINGERTYLKGTNWTPLDVFHSRDKDRLEKIFGCLLECNCNAVRCWGGNVYENDLFYDLCDRYGIVVWQDFAMACAYYPQDEIFQKKIAYEVRKVVRRLRNHPSIILWAGDNECDINIRNIKHIDPNGNVITRKTIPEVLDKEDGQRPYLPSSPYVDERAYSTGKPISEDHNWGDRCYFKGELYVGNRSKFLSEIGFSGMPVKRSLIRFIRPDRLFPWKDAVGFKDFCPEGKNFIDAMNKDKANDDWLVHSTCIETELSDFSYTIPLMAYATKNVFGDEGDTLERFILKSQIVQAEALKFIIERRRIRKNGDTGVLWWSLTDGWPEISNSIVDYYFNKKLSFEYVKAAQSDFCVVIDEHNGDTNDVYAVNDFAETVKTDVAIKDVGTGETVFSVSCEIPPHTSICIGKMSYKGGFAFFLTEWKLNNGSCGKNTYCPNIHMRTSFEAYLDCLEKSGFLSSDFIADIIK